MLGFGLGLNKWRRVGGGVSFDPDYQAVLDYATTQGYTLPSPSQQIIQNQLVLDLKAAGVWDKLDSFAVLATDGDDDFALVDWIRLATLTASNSPTFVTNQGYYSDGSTSYIDSTVAIDALGSNYQLGDASFGAWVYSVSGLVSSNAGLCGTDGSRGQFYAFRSQQIININNVTGTGANGTSQSAGFMTLEENGVNAISRNNGVAVTTLAGGGSSLPTGTYCILRSASQRWAANNVVSCGFAGAADVPLLIQSPFATYMAAI
jgi:hypothetical protein